MNSNQNVVAIIDEISHALYSLAEAGCRGFDCSARMLETLSSWDPEPRIYAESLSEIRIDLGDCTRCGLSPSRTNIVFGTGSPTAELMFVGEGPGAEEDRQGEPFVGAAGQLLTKIIDAIQLSRSQVYICNVIKCRPPGNRNPTLKEIETCTPFLERQIAAVKPDFICALGTFAAQTLLKTTQSISRLRGRLYERSSAKVLPTYHPAYLLRNPAKKREVWNDMQLLMKKMDQTKIK